MPALRSRQPAAPASLAASATVAVAVAERADQEGLARAKLTDPVQQVQDAMWQPVYRPVTPA